MVGGRWTYILVFIQALQIRFLQEWAYFEFEAMA